jgi:aminoglycoside phosphotransferase (APT) family kinase protein
MTQSDGRFAPGSQLPGGNINPVARDGDTVRRPLGPNASFVHRLLRFLEERGFDASPCFLGIDEDGREVLSFMHGHVAWAGEQPEAIGSQESLEAVARIVRSLHDLTSGSELAGDAETVVHGDLAPRNTVYIDRGEGLRPAAFIDWDLARPGRRVEDVVDMLWQYLDPGPGHSTSQFTQRMRLMCGAYGLEAGRRDLVGLMHRRMLEVVDGIASQADSGSAAHERLVEKGTLSDIRAQVSWLAAHRYELETALAQRTP